MAALLERSGLTRSKHERPDYMHKTIGKACAWQKNSTTTQGHGRGCAVPADAARSGIGLDDFFAYIPQKSYIFVPNRELWVASGVDDAAPWPDGLKPARGSPRRAQYIR